MITINDLEERLKRGYELTVTNNNGEINSTLSFKKHEFIESPCEKINVNHIIDNFAQIKGKLEEPMTECKVSYDFDKEQYKSQFLRNNSNLSVCKSDEKKASITLLGNSLIDSLLILDSKINFEEIVNNFINIMCSSFLMIIVLFICKLFIPITSTTRIMNLVIILVYTVIGAIVYFTYNHFSKLTNKVFGRDIFKILNKLFFRK